MKILFGDILSMLNGFTNEKQTKVCGKERKDLTKRKQIVCLLSLD